MHTPRQCHFTKKAVEATRTDQEVSELTTRSPGEKQLPRVLVTKGLGLKAMSEAEGPTGLNRICKGVVLQEEREETQQPPEEQ